MAFKNMRHKGGEDGGRKDSARFLRGAGAPADRGGGRLERKPPDPRGAGGGPGAGCAMVVSSSSDDDDAP